MGIVRGFKRKKKIYIATFYIKVLLTPRWFMLNKNKKIDFHSGRFEKYIKKIYTYDSNITFLIISRIERDRK